MGKYNLFADEFTEVQEIEHEERRMEEAMRKDRADSKATGSMDIATGRELKEKLEQQQYCCALSGLPLTPDTAVLDHIVPVTVGGGHAIDNVQWLHTDVNKMKHTLPEKRLKALCRLISGCEQSTEEDW
jgi:5-methylcytosine-specific restriction endonuclease McrA